MLDVVDSCTVTLGGKVYDTIRVMVILNNDEGVAIENYLDRNGRDNLTRRFNHDNWMMDVYKQKWSEKLPRNERIKINGNMYVHWFDGISDYVCK